LMNLAFSPDGSLLASGHTGGGLSLWNRISGRMITNIAVFEHEDFGPCGSWCYSRLAAYHIQAHRLQLSLQLRIGAGLLLPAWSGRGSLLQSGSEEKELGP
jgi:WD40 repeat protein